METYKVPSHIDPDKIFLVNRSELMNRLDPIYYNSDLAKLNISKYQSVTINSIAISLKSGTGAGKQDQTDKKRGIIQIRPTNIDENGFLKYNKNIYIPDNSSLEKVEINDILFNNTNSQELVGKTAVLKEKKELLYSNHITKIRVNLTKVIPDYLWIILNLYQKNKIFYSICTNWNNQSGVGLELLKSLKIPLPPLEIQQQIVDLYQEAYQQKQQKEAEAKTLLESIDTYLLHELGITLPQKDNSLQNRIFTTPFSEVSGGRLEPKYYTQIYIENEHNLYNSKYSLISVSKITSIVSDGTHFTPKYVDEGIKFISVKDVRKSTIDLNNSKYITEEEANSLDKRCKPQFGDILLTKVGTIGLAAVVQTKERFQIFVSLALLRPKHNIVFPEYLEIILNSECTYLQYDRIVKGAGVPDLHLEDIRKIKIPLPPIEKQNEIAEHIQGIRAQAKELQEQAQKILEEAKQEVEKMILGE
ncbi:hypothetical protein ETU10_08835 [Apibacter muscae]|uniref:restriction endonuclease subunit S n=1 Tax=Apibacter muscae TaxID=2509004 RepID=UPI0011AC01C9|nr:restriction endonuclease subunit S [Apibacter muscae]TWP22692.1 hypothetical protein ETU10_08835 [Apibacter muscae]